MYKTYVTHVTHRLKDGLMANHIRSTSSKGSADQRARVRSKLADF